MTNKLYFSMSELIHSDTANVQKINNMPDINSMDCILDLIHYVLNPLRVKAGRAINISSGYRCKELNNYPTIKGAANSQHTKGQAADFTISGMTVAAAIDFVKKSGVEYDQLVNEYNKWVHISFVKNNNRKECFAIK